MSLIGQNQLEVNEEGNSYAAAMSWALRTQSDFEKHREGQVENMSHSEESSWLQGVWPEHLEEQSYHLLRWERI